jgi:hypothetical protein
MVSRKPLAVVTRSPVRILPLRLRRESPSPPNSRTGAAQDRHGSYEQVEDGLALYDVAVFKVPAPSLHLAHLQTHVSGGQPVRVEYERVGDELVARAVFDLPSPGQ